MKTTHIFSLCMAFMAFACNAQTSNSESMEANMNPYPSNKTKEEWKKELSPEQYYVLFEKGTERPGTGQYNLHFEEGTYNCGACGTPLFTSDMKFDSHCGWPSFDREIEGGTVVRTVDKTHGMIRTEITCANCGGHLGHVFNDGPTETGERYCVNSLSLDFEKKEEGSN